MEANKLRRSVKEFPELIDIFGSKERLFSLATKIEGIYVDRWSEMWKSKETFRTFDLQNGDFIEESFFLRDKQGNTLVPYIARQTKVMMENGKEKIIIQSNRPRTIPEYKWENLERIVYVRVKHFSEEIRPCPSFRIIIIKPEKKEEGKKSIK